MCACRILIAEDFFIRCLSVLSVCLGILSLSKSFPVSDSLFVCLYLPVAISIRLEK